ncbi:MAG: hypothetical protein UY92_C0015G0033 [Candidatus Magasanikbacteria bacterium GW2011_GWA2_56_11]|uniref:GtrA/DPMS transmembrane domain-containing protein n=1 Tax=Candidatus Magasanikbacteria bacterium GW2011_GWA2_56_11 TaxID=1619044 RepID=A0A0G1YEI7_9BACT|nr:MAG: hypothetical protein UY92_C0015G0033 [Candidatus Magasanikbacteria bacterium GW2011_GWA2_56_11]
MLNKLLRHFWRLRREFTRYFIIGISAFVLDIGSLYALKEYAGLTPVWSVVVNQIFLLNAVFLLNKYWSFQARGYGHRQAARFYLLAGANYLFSIAWMWFLSYRLEVHYLPARIGNIVLAVGWNFFLYKYWVYREAKAEGPLIAG